ncbi:hypothetical protein [Haliea sp. E17]|uniref:hypothetical protein n=1 Tax=Haliea sp. E17 TaxID=3401576 RepID=UPI003AABE34C
MNKTIFNLKALALAVCVGVTACAAPEQKPPAGVTFDGLEPVPEAKFATVYKKPGADLSIYKTYGVAPCEVAFRKNWLRDQNQNRIDLTNRVTKKDVDRIKTQLGEMCTETFTKALQAPPPYTLVEEFTEGEEVLVLAPAIINLDINAPDIMSPGISRSYTTQSGEMTLLLELKDATTGDVLYRIVDRQKDFDDMQLQWTNSVTNRADAQRILNRWGKELRDGLDKVTAAAQ